MKINSSLKRYPDEKFTDGLQAWDSADELLLEELGQHTLAGKRVVVLNDTFGALSQALMDQDLTTYTDSYVAAQAIRINTDARARPLRALQELTGTYDYALIRIPKNMSYFEDMLCRLSAHLNAQSQVVCGYMIKHQAKAAFDLLNRILGETRTSLAKKKARLIFTGFQKTPTASPYPLSVDMEVFEKVFVNHSNLFSREKLDMGTRFLLENIPRGDYETVLDLGCGNGVLGIAAKLENPDAQLIFSDDSWMAIQSAQVNFAKYFPGEAADFLWLNCYENQPPASVDLVLCNPPFHQGNTLGDFIAQQMFKDAHRALVPGGTLRVIGNSHLKYHFALKKHFGNYEVVAADRKFMVMDAFKQ